MRGQLRNRGNAGPQIGDRQHLCFIENHHAVCQIMKFPAAGGAVCVQGFKELHRGCDDNRHIPIFGGTQQFFGFGGGFAFLPGVIPIVEMMF